MQASRWWNAALEATKLAGILYAVGLFVSLVNYSRYRIVSLDLVRPQAVFIGLACAGFLALPAIPLFAWIHQGAETTRRWRAVVALAIGFGAYLGILRALTHLESVYALFAAGVITTGMLLPVAWRSVSGVAKTSRGKRRLGSDVNSAVDAERFLGEASQAGMAVGLGAAFLCYIFVVFPSLPGYLGGGRPYTVHVFTDKPNLVSSRFASSKNRPQINMQMDSYRMLLLYESADEYYFLELRKSSPSKLEGTSVMRIQKRQVLRIDYNAPRWVVLERTK